MNLKDIKEDVPVTTTANNGAGLVEPQKPIKPTIVRRAINMLAQRKKETNK